MNTEDFMAKGELVLHKALLKVLDLTSGSIGAREADFEEVFRGTSEANQVVRQALVDYADAVQLPRHPVCWNVGVVNGYECLDHPEVRGTCYDEVWRLVGTSGCSKDTNMWQWSVMGVITTNQGKLLVNPGDWVVQVTPEHFLVLDDTTYRKLYL